MQMTHELIEQKVKKIVADQLSLTPDKIVNKAGFVEDLGADSLDTVELIMAFEEEFGIDIPDEVAETIKTIQQAIDFIANKVKPEV